MIKWEILKAKKRKIIRNIALIFIFSTFLAWLITSSLPQALKEEIRLREEKIKEISLKLDKTEDENEKMFLKSQLNELESELLALYEFTGKEKETNWKEETKAYLKKLEEEYKHLKRDYSATLSREHYRVSIASYKYYLEHNIPPGERKNIPLIIIFGILIGNLGNIVFPLLLTYLNSESLPFEKENRGLIWILQTKNGRSVKYVIYKYLAGIMIGPGICLLFEAISMLVLGFIYRTRWDIPLYLFTQYTNINNEVIPIYGTTLAIPTKTFIIYAFLYHFFYLITIYTVFYLITTISQTPSKSYFFSLLILILSIVIETTDKAKKFSPWLPFSHYDVIETFKNTLVTQTKNTLFHFPFSIWIFFIWSIFSLILALFIFLRKIQKNWSITRE